jgi:hypothetical protein
VTDLHGILFRHYIEKLQNMNDHDALKSDWGRVGQDLANVITLTQNRLAEQLKDGIDLLDFRQNNPLSSVTCCEKESNTSE